MKCDVALPGLWSYQVQVSSGAEQLTVRAEFPSGVPATMAVDQMAHPYLRELQRCTAQGWVDVAITGASWHLPSCKRAGCSLRYRYDLRRAAMRIDRFGYAAVRGGSILSPPTTWLLHPKNYQGNDLYQFQVQTASGDDFVTGVWSAEGSPPGTYRAPARLLFEAPYSAFGKLRRSTVELHESRIQVAVVESQWPLLISDQELVDIVKVNAQWVARYYGRYPVPQASVLVIPSRGDEVFGMELGNGGASILLFVGRAVSAQSFREDWVIIHEMLHLGFPTLPRSQRFWAEGLATYQEALIRARAGLWSEQELWAQMVRYLPRGQAGDGDQGLGKTQTWGRTYWGGALLCLLLDIELRLGSEGRVSLDDLAREILNRGGHTGHRWQVSAIEQVLEMVGGGTAAAALYRRHTEQGVRVDLEALFASLGVVVAADKIHFDDSAPLAALRQALVQPFTKRKMNPLMSSGSTQPQAD